MQFIKVWDAWSDRFRLKSNVCKNCFWLPQPDICSSNIDNNNYLNMYVCIYIIRIHNNSNNSPSTVKSDRNHKKWQLPHCESFMGLLRTLYTDKMRGSRCWQDYWQKLISALQREAIKVTLLLSLFVTPETDFVTHQSSILPLNNHCIESSLQLWLI